MKSKGEEKPNPGNLSLFWVRFFRTAALAWIVSFAGFRFFLDGFSEKRIDCYFVIDSIFTASPFAIDFWVSM